jgi:hypothetical protein
VRRGLRPWQADLRARSPSPAPAAVIKHKRRIEEIKELIDGKRTGRTKGSSEQQAVKNKLAELRGQFQALVVSWPARASRGAHGGGSSRHTAAPAPAPAGAAAAMLHTMQMGGDTRLALAAAPCAARHLH